jgi:hypothetical protein
VRQSADASVPPNPPDHWHNVPEFQVPSVPSLPLLEEILAEILKAPARLGTVCQLSTLVEGYGTGGLNRHVDGANGDELAWSGLLVGINLVDIPAADAGNLMVWPESHRSTQARFDALGRPTKDAVRAAIMNFGPPGAHRVLNGLAGTVTLMDHRLEHAMAPHHTPHLRRHVVYFRLPDFTRDPADVVNARHFLRHG